MAKASDSRARAIYADGDPDGDPLGELSDIMGISKDNEPDDDISLDLERELFGVNDDDPYLTDAGESSGDDSGPGDAGASLESELLAVLGGLNAAATSDETPQPDAPSKPEPPVSPDETAAAMTASADDEPADPFESQSDDLADLDLGDLDLGELEATDLSDTEDQATDVDAAAAAFDEDAAPANDVDDSELAALFADVMGSAEDITPADPVESDAASDDDAVQATEEFDGHDPLTIEDEVEPDLAALPETVFDAGDENADERDFQDDVELANVLAAPHPVLDAPDDDSAADAYEAETAEAEAEDDAYSSLAPTEEPTPVEPVASAPAQPEPAEPDPFSDAFSDLADLDVPSFIGTVAGTRAAMAAADAHAEDDEPSGIEPDVGFDATATDDSEPAEFSATPEPADDVPMADVPDSEPEAIADLDLDIDELADAVADDADQPETLATDDDAGHELAPLPEFDAGEGYDSDSDEEAFAQVLASTEAEMTDEDFEAAAAAIDAEADAFPTSTHSPFSRQEDTPEQEAGYEAEATDDEPEFIDEEPSPASESADHDWRVPEEPARGAIDIAADLAELDRIASGGSAAQDQDYEPLPDIDTAEVEENVAAVADFDVPEFEMESEPVVASGDEFEAEFAESLARYREESAPAAVHEDTPDESRQDDEPDFDTLFDRDLAEQMAAVAAAAGVSARQSGDEAYAADNNEYEFEERLSGDADADFDEPIGVPPADAVARSSSGSGRRGFMVASAVGALAIFGVAFAVGSSFFGGDEAPVEDVVIKADNEPVKIKPEDPGGATVPNQDNAVYDRVAGAANTEQLPAQESLITTSEEPVELPDQEAPEVPFKKAEDRLTPADTTETPPPSDTDVALVSPKRVRTMIVKPDGSLVPREEVVAEPAAPAETAPAPQTAEPAAQQMAAVAPEPVALAEPAEGVPADVAIPTPRPDYEPEVAAAPEAAAPASDATAGTDAADAQEPTVPVRTVRSETIRPTADPAETTTRDVSRTVPVPADRSADQPINVVGRTRAPETQTAAAQPAPAPAPTTAASDGYVVQIASLPSVAEAQSSFANLSSRYANLIGGRQMNIQRAEIAGKGTFYRVRIAAQGKSDAVSLCSRIKAAGGSCFVAR